MHTINSMALALKVGKSIIMRAAINLNIYHPLHLPKTTFDIDDFFIIKKEVELINKNKKIKKRKRKYEESNNNVYIGDIWKYDHFHNWKNNDHSLKFMDLFSGAGGVATGFSMAGLKPIQNFEIFKEANETYEYNFSKIKNISNHLFKEISVSDEIEVGKVLNLISNNVDIVAGGFPCQGFSVAGIRSSNDVRNDLYKNMADIVKFTKPKIVIMENVLGLLSMVDNVGNFVIDNIIELYQSMGYKADYKVLNAADYEVPQRRRRVIIIANNIGVENLFPKPIIENSLNYISSKCAIERFENWDENYEINHIFTKHNKETITKIKKLQAGQSLYENFSDAWKRLDENKPSYTIKENHGGVNIHYKFDRVLTPRELAALQSFPDDFIFKGNKSKQLVQIGNAVPPLLAKAIACSVIKMMEKKNGI